MRGKASKLDLSILTVVLVIVVLVLTIVLVYKKSEGFQADPTSQSMRNDMDPECVNGVVPMNKRQFWDWFHSCTKIDDESSPDEVPFICKGQMSNDGVPCGNLSTEQDCQDPCSWEPIVNNGGNQGNPTTTSSKICSGPPGCEGLGLQDCVGTEDCVWG